MRRSATRLCNVQATGMGMPFAREDLGELLRAEKWILEVQLVDGAHLTQILL